MCDDERSCPLKFWCDLSIKSQAMVLAGLIWIGIGIGIANEVGIAFTGVFHLMWPNEIRAALAIPFGAFAIVSGLLRWHKGWALAGLMILPSVRAVSFLYASLMALIPGTPEGYTWAWYYAMQPMGLMLLVWCIAHLPAYPIKRHKEI